jgi:hypothetical protein
MGRRGGKNKQKKAIEQKDPQEVRNEQRRRTRIVQIKRRTLKKFEMNRRRKTLFQRMTLK